MGVEQGATEGGNLEKDGEKLLMSGENVENPQLRTFDHQN
jgi:hypothetical protein